MIGEPDYDVGDFRIISGNPRQFNYRDESAGLCVSAQKIEQQKLISYISCFLYLFSEESRLDLR